MAVKRPSAVVTAVRPLGLPLGMGNYHGQDGFKTFSHMRAVYRQPAMDVAGMAGFKPPYGKSTHKTLERELRK